MKSVIQEGSSLAQAIEQGWIKAGKPREFTIKIFQDAKKNFFGFTKIPAKVGIFFKENLPFESKDKFQKSSQPSQQQLKQKSQPEKQFKRNTTSKTKYE